MLENVEQQESNNDKTEKPSDWGQIIHKRNNHIFVKFWNNGAGLEGHEKFVGSYKDASFEYTTSGGWIIRYNTFDNIRVYKILHQGDAIIIGYKCLVIISKSEFAEKYLFGE